MRMRIIAGDLRGRLFNVPDSNLIRPTMDRVRETLFNILFNMIDLEDIKVLDLYSGSGSLGFECLSRGAKEVHFVEKNKEIFDNLENNARSLNLVSQCKIYMADAVKFTKERSNLDYDLVLADPPFFKEDIYEVVKNLKENKIFKPEGFIIIERSIQTKEKDIEVFGVEPFKIIGDSSLYLVRH